MKLLNFLFLNLFNLPIRLNNRIIQYSSSIYYDEIFDIFENVRSYTIESNIMPCTEDEDCPAPYKCCNNPLISNFTNFCCIDNRNKLKVDYI